MYTLVAYLKHLFTSSNQHGVHSPFVYGYVTKCLYSKTKYKATKSENVLLKSIGYFATKTLKADTLSENFKSSFAEILNVNKTQEPPFDIIYLDSPLEDSVAAHQKVVHNDTMLLIANIHKSKKQTNLWEALKQHQSVTVSIDLFYCGALFFRKEQAKEHFKIRI